MRRLEDYFCNDPLGMLYNLEPEEPKPKPKPQYVEERVDEPEKAQVMMKVKSRRKGLYAVMADNLRHMRVRNLEDRGLWEIIAEGDILALKLSKETGVLTLADKTHRLAAEGNYLVIANDERKIKRAIADLYKVYRGYHRYIKAKKRLSASLPQPSI